MTSATRPPGEPADDPGGGYGTHDGALIERSRDEPEVFAVIFDRLGSELYGYVARRLDSATADDLVSEAFLIAFRRRGTFDRTRGDARPWLYGIVTRLIDQHRRTESRRYRALARVGRAGNEESHDERVTARIAAQSTHRRLGTAMAGLAARDRHVLLLYAWQELAYEEIAEALDIPVGTVRSRLNRARRRLRKQLDRPPDPLSRKELSYG